MSNELDVERIVRSHVRAHRARVQTPQGLHAKIADRIRGEAQHRKRVGLFPQVAMAAALVLVAAFAAFGVSRLRALNHPAPTVVAKPTPLEATPSPKASTVGAPITARYSPSLSYDDATGGLLLFGGFRTEAPYGALNDTWIWDGQSWQPRDTDQAPGPRTDASMVYDGATKHLLLFGGDELLPAGTSKAAVIAGQASGGGGPVNDTWTWDGRSWVELHPARAPSERFGALMAYDATRHQVVLFGGTGPAGHGLPFDDTWIWDGSTWTLQHPSRKPLGWAARAMVYNDDLKQVLLFASIGCAPESNGSCQTWQTWSWDGSNWSLRTVGNLSTETGYGVQVVYDAQSHTVVLFGGQILGGKGPNTYFSETWTWTLSSGWHRQSAAASPPPADYSVAAMTFDRRTGEVVLFQPGNALPLLSGAFWNWDGRSWSKLGP